MMTRKPEPADVNDPQ